MTKYITVLLVVLIPIKSYAITSITGEDCFVNNVMLYNTDLPSGCAYVSRQIQCGSSLYNDCTECESNYTLYSETVTVSSTESYTYGVCRLSEVQPPIQVTTCPDDCPSEDEWTSVTVSSEAICTGSIISKSCLYRCKVGYYGEDGRMCSRCPSSGGVYGTTAGAGATSITECYIPAGEISWTDDIGTYVCGGNSYYDE